MTKENLHHDLKEATEKLLEIARKYSWNTVSENCLYIMSEIQDPPEKDLFEQRRIKNEVNQKKELKPLQDAVSALEGIWGNLYDVNLYVYKSTSKLTVVEIQYYPKSSLDKDYFEKVKFNDPMLHCKVAIPSYSNGDNSKFDINWESGGFRHKWKMYWWRKGRKRS